MKNIIIFLLLVLTNQFYGQNIKVYNVHNEDKNPKLQWYETGNDLQAKKFSVWRTSMEENSFDNIQTLHYSRGSKKDTLLYTVLDTTLTRKAIYKYYIQLEGEDQKPIQSEVTYGHNMGYIPSPRVTMLEVNSSKTKKAIELNWQLNHNFSVRSLSIFRSSHHEKGFEKIAEAASDATSYTDLVPLSNHNYFYFILIADYFGYQHPSPPTPGACYFKIKPFRPKNVSLKTALNQVALSWENVEASLSGYKVYRSVGNDAFYQLHVMQTSNKLKEQFADTLPSDLKESVVIRYFVKNYSDSYVESNPSDTLSLFIEKPVVLSPPDKFDAISNENNQIKLLWSLPKSGSVVGYNLYLTKPTEKKMNKEIIPRNQNFFFDEKVYASGQYSFEIESVGKDNQVSEFRMKTGTSILTPYYHLVVDTKKLPTTFELQWMALDTELIKTISLYRQEDELSPVLLKDFENVNTIYKDSNLTKGKTYFYRFIAELSTGEKVVINDRISVRF